jgi:curved DNA-binding protein CbpA
MSTEEQSDPPPSFETVQDDPFAILGLDSTASDEEIKSAYRKLVLKCACHAVDRFARPLQQT